MSIKNYLTENKGKMYAALPSIHIGGQKKAVPPRIIIAEKVGISPQTVYMILTGKLDKTFASEETIMRVFQEAIEMLKSTSTIVEEIEKTVQFS